MQKCKSVNNIARKKEKKITLLMFSEFKIIFYLYLALNINNHHSSMCANLFIPMYDQSADQFIHNNTI